MDPVVAAAVADAHRMHWGLVLAAAARLTGDLDEAEECAQDAYTAALTQWAADRLPTSPAGWLCTVARRRAMDLLRRRDVHRAKLPLLVEAPLTPGPDHVLEHGYADGPDEGGDLAGEGSPFMAVPDDRLRLIFTCCHPALDVNARVALTLRLLCGLSTADVARAFLTSEPTMAARLTRAKKKIETARIPYTVPAAEDLPARLAAVLDVVHLLFTTGHTAPAGVGLVRRDLSERALDLARMLHRLLPADAGVAGLLALILLTDARRHTRTDADGRLVLLPEQNRALWDRSEIAEGLTLARQALRVRPVSRYVLMAAIAATHASAPRWEATDWAQILALYDHLVTLWPSPIVALNRAVAVGHALGPRAGLDALEPLTRDPQLSGYHYLPATRAEFLHRLNRDDEARTAYTEALHLTDNATEQAFLRRRLAELPP